jgi:ferredoxin
MIRKKAKVNKEECVACGSCIKVCPKKIINIINGIYAEIEKELCVGCQKCINECPASVIVMEEDDNEE